MLGHESDKPISIRQARLFRIGRSRAVRIPREFEFPEDEVIIHQEGGRLVVEPVRRAPSLAEVLSNLEPLEEDFPRIADPPFEPEDVF